MTFDALLYDDFEVDLNVYARQQGMSTVLQKDDQNLIDLQYPMRNTATSGQYYVEVKKNSSLMLKISNVTLENAGIYSCITNYNSGDNDNKTFLLRVQGNLTRIFH